MQISSIQNQPNFKGSAAFITHDKKTANDILNAARNIARNTVGYSEKLTIFKHDGVYGLGYPKSMNDTMEKMLSKKGIDHVYSDSQPLANAIFHLKKWSMGFIKTMLEDPKYTEKIALKNK
jgi:hypothetical protein